MKKYLAVGLVLLLALGIFSGCAGGDNTPSDNNKPNDTSVKEASGNKTDDTTGETVEISVMVFDRGNIPDDQGTIDDNRWTQWLNEQMAPQGVQMKFMPIPRSEEAQKIPVLMSSGTAADIMMSYDNTIVEKFYSDGGTYELSEYVAEYGEDLVKYIGQEVLDAGKNAEGEQFAIPARRATQVQNNAFIRKDWLDKLDLDIPETVDELYDALKAFKEEDPGNVGSDKIIAWNGGGAILSRAFLKELETKDYLINMVNHTYTDEGYRDYMRFMNKLYNEDLMDPEYFTAEDFGQRRKEYFVSGVAGYMEYDVNGNVDTLRGGLLQNLKQNEPDAEFISMVPVANVNDGKIYNISYPATGAFNFIPKTAENPEACMKYLNFLAGEGGFMVFHGVEGEHFEFDDGVPVVIDADYNAETKDYTRHDLFLVGNQGYYENEDDFAEATSKELPGLEQYVLDNYSKGAEGIRLTEGIYSSPTQIEQSGNIGKVNDDYSVKVTTCPPDQFDELYDEWIRELEKYDMEKIIQERTEYYNALMD